MIPSALLAAPGQISITLDGLGAQTFYDVSLVPSRGLGLSGTIEYRFSDFYSVGVSGGMVEYIAPTGQTDFTG